MGTEFISDINVRWGEMDAFGHVNNTSLIAYLEVARINWLDETLGNWQGSSQLPTVVNVNCNFRREIVYPCKLRIHIKTSKASQRRVLQRFIIKDRSDEDIIYADAECTLVWIDTETRSSVPVPETLAGKI